jgi:hypothetical protein
VTLGGFSRQSVAPYAPSLSQARHGYFQSLMLVWFLPWSCLLVTALLATATVRLIVAYRRYLKFDRPAATVLASQAILVLLLSILVVNGPHDTFGDELASYWRSLLGLPRW